MSKMNELYAEVAGDSVLQAQFSQIMAEAESAGQAATDAKLQAFAKEAGYEVSLLEMQEFFRNLSEVQQTQEHYGELSDVELDQVAGGKSANGGLLIAASVLTLGTLCALISTGNAIAGTSCDQAFQ